MCVTLDSANEFFTTGPKIAPDTRRVVEGRCPNAGHPCNCIGACQPIYVSKDDARTDAEIRAERAGLSGRSAGWLITTPKKAVVNEDHIERGEN